MTKLTDIQKGVLAKALAREDGAATPPANLAKAAAAKLAMRLVALKLVREMLAKADMPVWRKDRKGRPTSLVITYAGRKAVEGRVAHQILSEGAPKAIDVPAKASIPESHRANRKRSVREGTQATPAPIKRTEKKIPRARSKQALVLDMVQRPQGATLAALVSATGWLPHTVRAALTVLRQRGFAIERQSAPGGSASVYRLAAHVLDAA